MTAIQWHGARIRPLARYKIAHDLEAIELDVLLMHICTPRLRRGVRGPLVQASAVAGMEPLRRVLGAGTPHRGLRGVRDPETVVANTGSHPRRTCGEGRRSRSFGPGALEPISAFP